MYSPVITSPLPMTDSHTPGPWLYDKWGSRYSIGLSLDGSGVHHVVAVTGILDAVEQEESNARLISAAPDLLEVCQDILSDHHTGRFTLPQERLAQLRDALSKAAA